MNHRNLLAVVCLVLSVSFASSAVAQNRSADCSSWQANASWGSGPFYIEETVTLEQNQGGTWVAIQVIEQFLLEDAPNVWAFSGSWGISPLPAGEYRAQFNEVLYNAFFPAPPTEEELAAVPPGDVLVIFGTVGPFTCEGGGDVPCVNVAKQVSVDGGTTFLDADSPATAAEATGGAIYRIVISNCGTVDVVDRTISDSLLGTVSLSGSLAPGEMQILTHEDFPELNQPTPCDEFGIPVVSTTSITGEASGLLVAADDEAWVVCAASGGNEPPTVVCEPFIVYQISGHVAFMRMVFDADDDSDVASLNAHVVTGCQQIPVGQDALILLVDTNWVCFSFGFGIPFIFAPNAELVVTATDDDGETSSCSTDLDALLDD